jgi:hypothetical protein
VILDVWEKRKEWRAAGVQKKRAALLRLSSGKKFQSVAITTATTTTGTAATTAAATAGITTTTAASTTTAVTTTTAASTTTWTTAFLGFGFIDGQGATTMFLAIESRDGGCSFSVATHFHETETLAPTGFPVRDDFGALDGAMRAKQFLQRRAIHVIAHVSDIQLLAH